MTIVQFVFVQNTLLYPDERQLMKGVKSTEVPAKLQSMVDSLVSESTRMQEGCGDVVEHSISPVSHYGVLVLQAVVWSIYSRTVSTTHSLPWTAAYGKLRRLRYAGQAE